MEETKDKLSKPIRPPSAPVGIRARRENITEEKKDLSSFPNRIALIFDDSGSMGTSRMQKAKEATEAFVKAINIKDTAIAVYPLNADNQPLTDSMSMLYLYVNGINSSGGTPILRKLEEIIRDGKCNKVLLFSDGSPDHRFSTYNNEEMIRREDEVIAMLTSREITVDTVLIENEDTNAIEFMKKLAEKTNGIFLKFTDASIFSKNLKYLAPAMRFMLTDGAFRDKIQKGEA